MLPGQPGTPEGDFSQFQFAQQATQAIRSGAVKPFVGVFPPLMIAPPRDTECTDVPHGPQAETWLAKDVRTAVLRDVRITPDGKQWSAAGWSTGGFCAAKLLLRRGSDDCAVQYDTQERRRALADQLVEVADAETVDARARADTSQAKSTTESTKSTSIRSPRARLSRGATTRQRQRDLAR